MSCPRWSLVTGVGFEFRDLNGLIQKASSCKSIELGVPQGSILYFLRKLVIF